MCIIQFPTGGKYLSDGLFYHIDPLHKCLPVVTAHLYGVLFAKFDQVTFNACDLVDINNVAAVYFNEIWAFKLVKNLSHIVGEHKGIILGHHGTIRSAGL